MGIFTGKGTVVSISSTTTPPATFDAAGYAALTWIEGGCISELGEFGPSAAETTFTCLNDGIVQKLKGSIDNGSLTLSIALDDTTAGYDAFVDAFNDPSAADYYIRVQYGNAQNATGEGAIRYFAGKVTAITETVSGADDVVTFNVTFSISGNFVRVNSTAGA